MSEKKLGIYSNLFNRKKNLVYIQIYLTGKKT